MEPSLSLEEAAARLGVHYMTVYRYIRTGRLDATYEGGRWHVDPRALASVREPVRRRPRTNRGAPDRRLLDRMVAGDGAGAWRVVEDALMAGSPADVYVDVIGPSLRALGEGWADGTYSVGDEHRATAVAQGVIGRMGPLFHRPGRHKARPVVLAGAPGDSHILPVTMVGDVMRAAGYQVVQLGADVPVETLLHAVETHRPAVVGLSAGTEAGARRAGRARTRLGRSWPDLPVMLGGPAIPDQAAARARGADGWAPDASRALDVLAALVAAG